MPPRPMPAHPAGAKSAGPARRTGPAPRPANRSRSTQKVARWAAARHAEDFLKLVWRRNLELIVSTVARPFVRPPAQEYRRVAKAPSLQMVVLDLADPFQPQRLPGKILAR